MKIQKEKSRTYKGQSYYKYKLIIPENILVQSKLKAGDELDVNIENEKLTLVKKRS